MKLVFLAFANIKYLPFLDFYLSQCDVRKNDVHLVYWDREMKTDAPIPDGMIPHCFKCKMQETDPSYKRISSFARYGSFARKVIRKVKPDKIVVMYATTAITVFPLLTGKYKNKYIFDYRDISHEKHSFYKNLVGKIVRNSYLTFASSDGFRPFLPEIENKIFTSHNLQKKALMLHDGYKLKEKRTDETPIRISMWGLIRNFHVNKKIIEQLGGDSRFELHYYGNTIGDFSSIMKGYPNVFYHGEYMPDDVYGFAREADILLNIYDNHDATMPYAMANKFYDGLVYYIPQLCSKGSFMGEKCGMYGVGFACDPYSDSFADDIYSYYRSLDRETFADNCDAALREIMTQVETDERLISSFFESE